MIEVRDAEGGAILRVRVSPRASREGMGGEREGALVVRVSAPPVEGAANAAVTRLVAEALDLPASSVEVVRGASGREKALRVRGLSAAAVRQRLAR